MVRIHAPAIHFHSVPLCEGLGLPFSLVMSVTEASKTGL